MDSRVRREHGEVCGGFLFCDGCVANEFEISGNGVVIALPSGGGAGLLAAVAERGNHRDHACGVGRAVTTFPEPPARERYWEFLMACFVALMSRNVMFSSSRNVPERCLIDFSTKVRWLRFANSPKLFLEPK